MGLRRWEWVGLLILVLVVRLFFLAGDCPSHAEDSYYSLTVARSLARGQGASVEAGRATNGFQPLPVLLAVPTFWLLGSLDGAVLPAVHLLALLADLAAGLLLARLALRLWGSAEMRWTLLLWAGSPFLTAELRWSFETSVYVALVAAVLLLAQRALTDPEGRGLPWLGLAAGGMILGRIDGAFLAAAVVALGGLAWWRDGWRPPGRRILASLGLAAAIPAPWFLYGALAAGGPFPVSGPATRQLALLQEPLAGVGGGLANIRQILAFLGRAVPPLHLVQGLRPVAWYRLGAPPALQAWLEWLAPTVILLLAIRGLRLLGRRRRTQPAAGLALLFGIALVGAYGLYALGQWNYPRYMTPLVAVATPFAGRGMSGLGRAGRAGRILGALLGLLLLPALLLQDPLGLSRFPFREPAPTELLATAAWLDEHLPPDAVVGAYESGFIGYFTRRRVINLDGVVNRGAYEALRRGCMDRYLARRGIDYVVIRRRHLRPWLMERCCGAPLRFDPVHQQGGILVFRVQGREDPEPLPRS